MAKQQKVRLDIPDDLTPGQREVLGLKIADHIRNRTREGVGFRNGRRFDLSTKPYSKEYIAKKGSTFVDLTLSEDMLDELDLLTHRKGSLTVGYEKGDPINDKVEGNQIGSYGRTANPKKARPFLGLTKTELRALIRETRDET